MPFMFAYVCAFCARVRVHTSAFILLHTSALAADSATMDALGFAVVRPRLPPVLAAIGYLHDNINEKYSTCNVGFSKLILSAVIAGSHTKMVTALRCECLQDFHTCEPLSFSYQQNVNHSLHLYCLGGVELLTYYRLEYCKNFLFFYFIGFQFFACFFLTII